MTDSTTTRPRLSIGLPVFNGARFLPAAIDSLLDQTFGDFELIISDNASTDETQEVAEEYARRDSRIVYVRHELNRGAPWNFNYVVGRAQAEYFKWHAADDLCAPTLLERSLDLLEQDPSVICCHARTRKIDERGNPLVRCDDPTDGGLPTEWFTGGDIRGHRPDGASPSPSRRFADVLLYSGWGVRSFGMMRTSILRQTSLIRPYYGSEKVLMAELVLRGRCHDVPETLFFQRVHEGASSQQSSAGRQAYLAAKPATFHTLPRWQHLCDYVRVIQKSELGLAEKSRCWCWLARYVVQLRKWPGLLACLWQRSGQTPAAPSPAPAKASAPASMAAHP
jgi:glycosyltransferase involved in cell wall biosynthesis